ncbi:MAG: nitroreductase [Hyphomicrobiaceae bacterium]|jgi:nitroreductase
MQEIGIYEAMSTLRAVRRLRPDPIPEEVLHRVLQAATWAPTGANRQPWRMIVVQADEPKAQLGKLYAKGWNRYAAYHRGLLTDAPEAIRINDEKMLAAGDYLGEHFGEAPAIVVFAFDPSQMAITDAGLDRPSVVGGGSIYPAVENLLLACRAEGLGCVLTTLLCTVESQVREILGFPDSWGTAAAIPIGYPKLRGHGPITRRPVEKMAYRDTWGASF